MSTKAEGRVIQSSEVVSKAVHAAIERKAIDVVALDLSKRASFTDAFVVCSGTNKRHVAAIADGIIEDLKKLGRRPLGVEGIEAGKWVLIDYGNAVIHVFEEAMRGYYDLDGLWLDAPRLAIEQGATAQAR